MAELYEVLNKIVENDVEDQGSEAQDTPVSDTETKDRDNENERQDEVDAGEYDVGGIEGRVSNSVGRGAVENWIKNIVYEKYDIDAKSMKDFSR